LYTHNFGDTYKWIKFSRTIIDGEKPENSCSIYLKQSKRIHYDVVQDVCLSDLKHQFSQNSESDDIHSHDRQKETFAKKQSESKSHTEKRQTKGMLTKESAKLQSTKKIENVNHNNIVQ